MNRILKRFALAGAMVTLLAACGTAEDAAQQAADDIVENAADPTSAPSGSASDTSTAAGPDTGDASGDVDRTTGLPLIDPIEVTGDISSAGSSTVFPLSEAVTARFIDEGFGGQITVDSIGSGAGFERFCVEGETDISQASRPINEEEVAACESIGRTPLEIRVGTDALAVAVSTSNYFVESLTLEELAVAFSTASTWADVNPGFPAHPVARFSPGTDSGTFDYFVEAVFEEDPEPLLAGNPQLSEDDNVLVQGVSGDACTEGDESSPCAVGYFGYAYFVENSGTLRAVSIDGVEPSAESVDAGEYPLARPLFVYSAASIIEEKPQVGDFLAFYLNTVDEVIDDVGYFPAPAEATEEAAASLAEAAGF